MQTDFILRDGRVDARDLHKFVTLPRELTSGSGASDLARAIRPVIDDLVNAALAQPTVGAFDKYVVDFINDFILHTQVLLRQITRPGPLPQTTHQSWLVDVLGVGADAEMEFCESTLWSSFRRLPRVDLSSLEGSGAPTELGRRLATAFYVGLFCWLVIQRSATTVGSQPEAVRAALRMLRDAAMDTVVGIAALAPPDDEPELFPATMSYGAEDVALLADDS